MIFILTLKHSTVRGLYIMEFEGFLVRIGSGVDVSAILGIYMICTYN